MGKDHIKEYWENQAKEYQKSHWASWGDNWIIDLEIENISKYIKEGNSVLDVGCANGYSTFQQLKKHNLQKMIGIDFSENMINVAKEKLADFNNKNNIFFEQGDVRSLRFADNMFDIVYTTRVIINLATWEEQIAAIQECIRVTKPNGTIILSEGFWEPLMMLNSMRLLSGLEPLVEHDFNRYLKISKVMKLMHELELTYEIVDFSSIYYIGSRLLRELVTDFEKYEGFTNPINEIFANIQRGYSGGGMGVQQAIVITKK